MGKVICKACNCENSSDDIFCRDCGKMIMTSEYLGEDVDDNSEKRKVDVEEVQDKQINKGDKISNLQEKTEVDVDYKKKKTKIRNIVLICLLAVAVIVGVVIGVISLMPTEIEKPTQKEISAQLNKDRTITEVEINGKVESFEISKVDIRSEEEIEERDKYVVDVSIVRKNELYQLNPINYTLTYKNVLNSYKYDSAKPQSDYELTLTPLKGYSVKKAEKRIKKLYKGAKFLKQETDLKKGTDKIYFKVNNQEVQGTVFSVYKFNNKTGWKFKKINDDKLEYKPGVTHQEGGLYTNTGVKNIMFFGVDADGYSGRSDCMMLVSIDTNNSKIKLTSFMRDTYVQIPGNGGNKLNAAYALGGPELAVSAIANTYGIKIDNYASTNFTTFKNIINSLGGVSVNITADEAGYINWQLGANGQSGVGLVPAGGGNVRLNGQQALWLCRNRGGNGFSGNDFTRTGRQRKVIKSLISSYKSYSPSQVLSTLNNIKGNVVTDLGADDLKWLAENSGKLFNFSIEERCVPDDGEWYASYSPAGAWIIAVNDWNYLKADIQKYLYEDLG